MNFDMAFERLLGSEGAFVDHPSDPGGATMWGITERVARANGYAGQMRNLPVSEAKRIAKASYWDVVKADALPEELRYPTFDAAYNSGPAQAAKWLQRAVGVSDDGKIGPQTLAAARAVDAKQAAAKMIGLRLRFMTDLKNWPSFSRGWSRRIADLLIAA